MPIAEVTVVGEPEGRIDLAQRVADAIGRALGSRPQGTWVTLRVLADRDYAENGGSGGLCPVIVRLLQRELPPADALGVQAQALAQAVAMACGRPAENVHVIFEPPGIGRVAFGGTLVT